MHDNNLSFFYPRFKMKAWGISEMFSLTKVIKHALINLPWFVPLNKNSCKGVLPTLRKVIHYWFFFIPFSQTSSILTCHLHPSSLNFFVFLKCSTILCKPPSVFFLFPQSSLSSDFCFDPFEMSKLFVTNRTPLFLARQILARRKSCDLETKAMSFWFANLVVLAGLHNEAGKLSC